ncbi:MAG: outer membrane protein assembly factor BamD [bacterium]|nr:outer membrane protein assembly factor BamD [bacterium]
MLITKIAPRIVLFLLPLWLTTAVFAQPRDPAALYTHAYNTFQDGKLTEAETLFRNYLSLFPDEADAAKAQFYSGECLYRQGKMKEALQEFQQVIDHYPASEFVLQAKNRRGDAYQRMGDLDRAAQEYSGVTKSSPQSMASDYADYSLDWLRDLKGVTPAPGRVGTKEKAAAFIPPLSEEELLTKAKNLFDTGEYTRAQEEFKRYLVYFPTGKGAPYARLKAAECDYENKNFAAALDGYGAFLNTYPESKYADYAAYSRGWCQYHLGDYEKAISTFNKFIKEYPESRYNSSAKEAVNQIAKEMTELEAERLFDQAREELRGGRLSEAKNDFETLLKKYPKSPHVDKAMVALARIEREMADLAARALFEKAKQKEAEGDLEGASNDLDAILDQYSDSAYYPESQKLFKEITKRLDQVTATTLYDEANTAYRAGELERAKANLRRLVNNYPDSPYFEGALTKLKEVEEELADEKYRVARAVYEKGQKRYQDGDYKGALESFRDLIDRFPESEYAELARAAVKLMTSEENKKAAAGLLEEASGALENKQQEKASEILRKITKQYPLTPQAEQAEEMLLDLLRKKEDKAAYEVYRDALQDLGENRYQRAVRKLEQLTLTYPESSYVEPAKEAINEARRGILNEQAKRDLDIAQKYYVLGDYERALEGFQRVKEAYPTSDHAGEAIEGINRVLRQVTETKAEESYQHAKELYKEGSIGQAYIQYQRVIDEYPESKYAKLAREALTEIGQRVNDELAKDNFDAGQEFQRYQDYKAAIKQYDAILTKYPYSHWAPNAQYAKAESYYAWHKDMARARAEWEKVVENYPNSELAPDALYHAADSAEAMGDLIGARSAYRKLLENYPGSKYSRGELAEMVKKRLEGLAARIGAGGSR